jgi:chromosome segregation ATPase
METFNIIDYKSQLDSLSTQLINEYMKLEKHVLDIKQVSTKEQSTMNNQHSSMCSLLQSKEDTILSLELELEGYKSREQEYKNTIENNENNKNVEPETEVNKFSLLRGQAKEISAKDKEIKRLTNELGKLTNELGKLKEVKHDLSMVINEVDDDDKDTKGWSPTTSKTPTPPAKDETTNEVVATVEMENDETTEESFYVIKIGKKSYYRDDSYKVYNIDANEEVGEHIGSCKSYGAKGKFKLVNL